MVILCITEADRPPPREATVARDYAEQELLVYTLNMGEHTVA